MLEGAVQGFSATLSPEQARKLASEPDVEYVQQEHTYQPQTSQVQPPSWGVDRLDQRRGLGHTYNYIGSAGAGVHAYIIDSGIRNRAGGDIDGRVEVGFNAIDGTTKTDDCFGHGTFIAGIVGGTQYGVAKKVSLVAVKVFDCDGTVDFDDSIIAGLNWVIANAKKPAVIDLSLGSTCKDPVTKDPAPCPAGEGQGIIDAEKAAIAAGIPVVTAAGNDDANACFNPVGSAGGTINVGATDASDGIWKDLPGRGSNWGGCVDIFAPGANIVSIGGIGHPNPNDPNEVDPDPRIASGTSAAAPHVTGAVALLLGTPKFASATPAEIAAELDAQSTRGIIQGLPGDGLTPNKLLFARPTSPRTGTTIALARNASGDLSLFGTNADSSTTGSTDLGGHMFTGTQVSGTWPTQWEQSRGQGYASVAAGTDGSVTSKMVLATLTAQDEVWHRQQAVRNAPRWLAASQLDATAAIAPNADRRLMLIGADKHGGLRYRSQRAAGDDTSWGSWGTISFLGDAQNVTAAPDSLGRINVFVAYTHGVVWYIRQTAVNADTWTTITPLADPTGRAFMNEIAVARDSSGKLELFGTDGGGVLWVRVENTPSSDGHFDPWTTLPLFPKLLLHLTAALNANNLLMVAGVDEHGETWQCSQDPRTAVFTNWSKVGGPLLRP
ncbi:S8 family serine peptidase [Kribbella sp. NBC_00359]|uniref:S8 family serine peptidase n=1 Tax=Kribbella sp. NBC_00359 TaxID=2975966 RepID=UPI002E20CA1C